MPKHYIHSCNNFLLADIERKIINNKKLFKFCAIFRNLSPSFLIIIIPCFNFSFLWVLYYAFIEFNNSSNLSHYKFLSDSSMISIGIIILLFCPLTWEEVFPFLIDPHSISWRASLFQNISQQHAFISIWFL